MEVPQVKRTKTAPEIEAKPLIFTRANPEALAAFDPRSKLCVMNCGPHAQDPRTAAERKFLCDECQHEGNP